MADIRPFAGLRFDPARVELGRVLCPPYDVIDPEQAVRLRGDDFNAVHLELPEGQDEEKYRGAARTWDGWRRSRLLVQDAAPAFYVVEERYELAGRAKKRVGFLAALGVSPKAARAIVPHERTLAKPKEDRIRLLSAVEANISPIFGILPDPRRSVRGALKKAIAGKPAATGVMPSGVRYRLWALTAPAALRAISKAATAQKILIADGHHRFEVSKSYYEQTKRREADTVLAYICPEEDEGLVMLPTHRILERRRITAEAAALAELSPCRDQGEMLKKLDASRNPYAFGLWDGGAFALGEPRDPGGCKSGLCVEWLGRRLLAELAPDQIRYTPDAGKAVEMARKAEGCALFVKAAPVSQIRKAVAAVGLLPPKSTYFYPKIATGLVFKSLEKR